MATALAVLGALGLLGGLAACGGGGDAPRSSATASAASSPTAPASAAPSATAPASAAPAPVAAVASHVPAAVDGANVTMESTTVDGLELGQVSCQAGGGMFGSLAILGALAKQKSALGACSQAPGSVRVHFAFADGKTSDVRVADAASPELAKCVADAVSAASFPDKGSCVATVKLPQQ
ncbi:MAG: hypothetical protein IT373_07700 [Polyangiaceae bacterium]|nr:hypothetical protein [Polyangiaceae bacterium]